MPKFLFTLIFTLSIFNFVIQGNNAAIKHSTSEDSNLPQNLENENTQETTNENISIEQKERRVDLSDEKTAAFTVIHEYDEQYTSFKHVLPSVTRKIGGKWSLSSVYTDKTHEEHLCPDIDVQDNAAILDAAYEENPALGSCLFIKNFEPNEPKICTKEPIPWLTMKNNVQPPPHEEVPLRINCNQENQKLLAFEYNNCDPVEHLLKYGKWLLHPDLPKKKLISFLFTATYLMYEICYDIKAQKTLWTKHHVLEPMLFYDPTIPAKNPENIDLNSIDTSTFSLKYSNGKKEIALPSNTFTNLKSIYEGNKNEEMKAAYLVPMRHMAMQNWKKSTHHLINVAPLHQKFHKLMQIIDDGLILASRHIFSQTGIHLQIFTTAETKLDWKNFAYNNWHKFIYNESNKSGALISLYGTKDMELQKAVTCGTKLHCDFNKWTKSEDNIVPEDVLEYTSCCGTREAHIKELFQIDVKIPLTLGIHQMVLSADEKDANIRFLRNHANNNKVQNSQQYAQDPKPNETQPNEDNVEKDSGWEEFAYKTVDLGSPSVMNYNTENNHLNEDESNDLDKIEEEKKESNDLQEGKDEKTPEEGKKESNDLQDRKDEKTLEHNLENEVNDSNGKKSHGPDQARVEKK